MIGQVPMKTEGEKNKESFAFSSSRASNGQISNFKKQEIPPSNMLSCAFDNDESDDELEPNLGSGNLDGAKGDNLKRNRYHRHTVHQIQELKAFFKECSHPNERQRKELGLKLGLNSLQVKFWFQNKRTQNKAQVERMVTTQLRAQTERLRAENMRLQNVLCQTSCSSCGYPLVVAHSLVEVNELRSENERLRKEIERIGEFAAQFFCNVNANSSNALAYPDLNVPHYQVNFSAANDEADTGAFEEQSNFEEYVVSEAEEMIIFSGESSVFGK